MIFKNQNTTSSPPRVATNSNKYVLVSKDSFIVEVSSPVFPAVTGPGNVANFSLTFNTHASLTIDFGDGTTADAVADKPYGTTEWQFAMYTSGANVVTPPVPSIPSHTYTDGQTDHVVTVYYPASVLVGVYLSQTIFTLQAFSFVFYKHPELKYFSLVALRTPAGGFPFTTLDLRNITFMKKLQNLQLMQCFAAGTEYYGVLPEVLLDQPLTVIGFGDTGFDNKPFDQSNIDQLGTATCAGTLQQITCLYAIKDSNPPENNPFPLSWTLIPNLTTLTFNSTAWTTFPAMLNQIPTLTTLNIRSASIDDWGDLSGLINLVNFIIPFNEQTPDTAPPWLVKMPKIKQLDLRSVYTVDRAGTVSINNFITSLYNLITGMSIPIRSVWLRLDSFYLNTYLSQIPDGTYQPPTGPAGTPVSSQERLYILDHNYQWTCNYRKS